MAKLRELHPELAAASITEARKKLHGTVAGEDTTGLGIDITLLHQHDGSMMQIAWNNVQAILDENRLIRYNEAPLVPVPTEATEGYNQHHHESPYDGGILPGISGGPSINSFNFAVFYPSTTLGQMPWE